MDNRENEEFTQYLTEAVRQAEQLKYYPNRFKGMLNADGGYETVKRILESGKPSEGFQKLWGLGRLDLTCEAIIVETKWRLYFDPELVARSENLLRQSDYQFKPFDLANSDTTEQPQSDMAGDDQVSPEVNDVKSGAMSRKKFLESQGATCRNWNWSWSFVNEAERTIIFGAWDTHNAGNRALILSKKWEISRRGRKQPGYGQAREHIRLVEEEGYVLKTFPMIYSEIEEEGDVGPAKIENFVPVLTQKSLIRVGNSWYASDDALASTLPEELVDEELVEGAGKTVSVNAYERNAAARAMCLAHHGYSCTVCSFDFESAYGELGKNYIHVHHIVPLSEIKDQYVVNPIMDLVPVCPNCHAMIHITRPCLSIEQLKMHLAETREG